MTSVTYDEATRTYEGTDIAAVDKLSIDVGDGELLVLVGPSGSGKSTALRMLAGLEPLDAGAIRIGERDVSNVRPRDRDIAMVFQNYALYPQLSVAENMGFALKQQGVPKEERRARVQETARDPRSRAVSRSQAQAPVRRAATARGDGARDRAAAGRVPDGRAALQPRRQAARADADRGGRAAGAPGRDDRVRHARPGRGHDDGPSGRGPEGRGAAAVRRAGHALPRAGQPVRGRLHRVAGDESRRPGGGAAAAAGRRRSSRSTRPPRARSPTGPATSRSASGPRRCGSGTGRCRPRSGRSRTSGTRCSSTSRSITAATRWASCRGWRRRSTAARGTTSASSSPAPRTCSAATGCGSPRRRRRWGSPRPPIPRRLPARVIGGSGLHRGASLRGAGLLEA